VRLLYIQIVVSYYLDMLSTVNVQDVDWIGNIGRGNYLLEHDIEGNMEGIIPG